MTLTPDRGDPSEPVHDATTDQREAISPERASSFDPERLSLALIGSAFVTMVAFSWQKWADPLIDFGRELYIPWRLLEGDLLYQDVAHYYAPLSTFVNVGWFKLLGVSYRSLAIGNTLILAAILAVCYWLLRRVSSLLATTTAIVVTTLVFALGQYLAIGNYNYISPYAHEVTHGLLLALLTLAALSRHFEAPSRRSLVTVGLFLGLVFLTKYEVLVAVLGGAVVGLLVHRFEAGREWRGLFSDLLTVTLSTALPITACWALLSTQLPAATAWHSVLGPLALVRGADLASSRFLWDLSGLATPALALAGITGWTLFYACATLPVALLGRAEWRLDRRLYTVTALTLPVAVLGVATTMLPLRQALLPLPFFVIAGSIAEFRRRERIDAGSPKRLTSLVLAIFSLLLLLRIPLNAGPSHYGFVLAMPGTLFLIIAVIDHVPAWLDARGFGGRLFRTAVFSLLALLSAAHLRTSAAFFSTRTYSLGQGADAIRVDARGAVVARAVEVVADRVGPQQTLVVFPEGAMVNYMARRRSSVSHVLFHPTALALYGEGALVVELAAHPPDYVLAFSREMRDLREFGCVAFGDNCAQKLGAWLKEGYRPEVIAVSGKKRLFTLLARVTDSSPPPPPEVIEVTVAR